MHALSRFTSVIGLYRRSATWMFHDYLLILVDVGSLIFLRPIHYNRQINEFRGFRCTNSLKQVIMHF